jgi:ubiquinone/menaquinone biosynthesis C-methylase UbiE
MMSDALAQLRNRHSFHGLQGSALDMPFKENTFDLAYSVSILEHIPDFPRALQEVSRVLKPGGVFVLTFDISRTPGQDILVDEVGSLFGQILSSGFAEVRHSDAKFVTMKQLRYDAIGVVWPFRWFNFSLALLS